MVLSPFSIDAVKGWTRCSAVAFIALAVSEMDVTDKETQDLLVPLHKVLDKSWLLPMHAAWINLVIAICFFTLLLCCKLYNFKKVSFQRKLQISNAHNHAVFMMYVSASNSS
jgi:hypothetical protein